MSLIKEKLDELCQNECKVFEPPNYVQILRVVLWVNFVITTLISIVSIVNIYRTWVKVKRQNPEWPYSKNCLFSKLRCLPRWLVGIVIFFTIIPVLLADFFDIFFDTKYFNDLALSNMIDERIHLDWKIFPIMFTFLITANVKAFALGVIAVRQVRPDIPLIRQSINPLRPNVVNARISSANDDESNLQDENIYEKLKYWRDILSFILEDAAESFAQYFFVDKFVGEDSWLVTVKSIIMVVFALVSFIRFLRHVIPYWKLVDTIQEHLRLLFMVLIIFLILLVHSVRIFAVLTFPADPSYILNCLDKKTEFYDDLVLPRNETFLVQTPFTNQCLRPTDNALIGLLIIASLIAIFGVVAGYFGNFNAVFTQSHYTGRAAIFSTPISPSTRSSDEPPKTVTESLRTSSESF